MSRVFDDAGSASPQPVSSEKRVWNAPLVTDEAARNTAAKGTFATELATTNGPGS